MVLTWHFNRWAYGTIALLAAITCTVLLRQRQVTQELRVQVETRQWESAERIRLNVEARKLSAAQVTPEELERLRADRDAIAALRSEIEAMKRRSEANPRSAIAPRLGAAVAKAGVSLTNSAFPVPASLWKNAGAATPEAAFETALWAAAGGDVETLAGLLVFDPEAQARAEMAFARLPANLQQDLVSPQRLIALLVAKDVPLGSAKIWAQYGEAQNAKIVAQLVDPQQKSKQVRLSLRSEGSDWRFLVPLSAVERYATFLHAPVEH